MHTEETTERAELCLLVCFSPICLGYVEPISRSYLMRKIYLAVLPALLAVSFAAYADAIQENFTVNGNANFALGGYAVGSSAFSQFDPTLGTLNSISINLSGQATPTGITDSFIRVTPSDHLGYQLTGNPTQGPVIGGAPFQIGYNGVTSDASLLAPFEGSGTEGLSLVFENPTADVIATGTLTYNYTPTAVPVAATPEPSSIALLGTGLLGIAGIVKRRLA